MRGRMLGAAMGILVLLVASAPAAHATPMPDLKVKDVFDPPANLVSGDSFVAKVVIKNAGKAKAHNTYGDLYLSPDDAIKDPSDYRLFVDLSTPKIPAGEKVKVKTDVTIPLDVGKGKYYLIACADEGESLIESNEENNCRASANPVKIEYPPCTDDDSEPNDDFAYATLSPTSGSFVRCPSNPDFFRFNMTNGQSLGVQVTPDADLDVNLELFNGAKLSVGHKDVGPAGQFESIDYVAPRDEFVWLKVNSSVAASAGGYSMVAGVS